MKHISCAIAILTAAIIGSTELRADNIRKDIIDRAFVFPTRILWTNGNIKNTDVLLQMDNGQSDVAGHPMCTLTNGQNDTTSIILDYGKELHGGIKIGVGGCDMANNLVRVRFGESVSECCSEPSDSEWKMGYSTNDHARRDFVIRLPRDGSIEFGNTGFRFVRLDLLERNSRLDIREASAILRYRDIPYEGSFKCSDDRLNSIWETGKWTVHLNMQEYIWDGIKRDRLVWVGDMHPEVSSVMAVFGYNDVIDRSLNLVCEQFPLPNWCNGISAYSMWYLIIQYDWYMQNGRKDYLEKHRGYIFGLVDLFDSKVNEDGSEDLSGRAFLDWPSSPNKAGVEAGYRALLCIAMDKASALCNILGDKGRAECCKSVRARLEKNVKPHNGLKQAAALMALADLMPADKACNEVVAVGGPKEFSTFYGYYMLEALAKAGQYQTAMDIISRFWGAMLDLGATSFWEDFNLDWAKNAGRIDEFTPAGKDDIHKDFGAYCYKSLRHSLCHGWASGPTAWMSRHILGVEVLEPGCTKVRVEPHLGNLEWAEGTYPTPMGVIKIRHDRMPDGSVKSAIKAPKGVKVVRI